MLTIEELRNAVTFIESGARAISANEPLQRAAVVLATADVLVKKLINENTPDSENQESGIEENAG